MQIRAFLRKHAMPLVALLAAAISCFFVKPDAEYASYIDVNTLACLASVLAVVGSLRTTGAIEALAHRITRICKNPYTLVCAIIATTGIISMFATNDMTLLALLPLSAAALLAEKKAELIAPTFVLQGLAANLCGMLLPFGNPQNIYLSGRYSIDFGSFVSTMALPFLSSCVIIALMSIIIMHIHKSRSQTQSQNEPHEGLCVETTYDAHRLCQWAVLGVLLGLSIAAVLRVIPAWIVLVIVCVVLILLFRNLEPIKNIDWGLLITFAAFFVFSGNVGRIGAVTQFFTGWMDAGACVPAALLSQVISNVPSSLVLAPFTNDWQGLLTGVNIGGAGTPVGSLATLIVISQFNLLVKSLPAASRPPLQAKRFMPLLLGLNVIALILLLPLSLTL
ncbi:MAG: hypothetical protein IKE43_03120 [Coriobacteriales bacterium]|nr:hypothetical protein [Coriobacteriales bacterium]